MKNYLRLRLYTALITPFWYIAAILFNVAVPAYIFFMRQFFSGGGTTDLYAFFYVMPQILSVIIPILTVTDTKTSDFLPLSTEKRLITETIASFIQIMSIVLMQVITLLCITSFGIVDAAQAFAGFFTVILYSLCAISVCKPISVLFKAGRTAVFVSMILLIFANNADRLIIYTKDFPIISSALKYFSFSWHFHSAAKGLLDTRDIIFFITLTFAFTAAACFITEQYKGKSFTKERKIRLISFAVIIIFTLIDSKLLYLKIDITKEKKYSVSKYTKELILAAEEPIKVSYYRSRLLTSVYPQALEIEEYLEEFCAAKNIKLETFNTDKTQNAKLLSEYGIYSRQIQTLGTNRAEFTDIYSAVIIEYQDKWDAIPFVLSADSLEYDLDSRLFRLITQKNLAVNVLSASERNLQTDFSYFLRWLNVHGIVYNELDVKKEIIPQLEPNAPLIIFGSSNLTLPQTQELEGLIEKNLPMIFAISPYNIDIDNAWYVTKEPNTAIFNMLESYGINFTGNIISDISCARITMQSYQNEDGTDSSSVYTKQLNYPFWIELKEQLKARQGLTLFWPAELTVEPEHKSLFTTPYSWVTAPDNFSSENLFQTNPFILEEGGFGTDQEKSLYEAVIFLDEKPIVIIPDQYFAANLTLQYIGGQTGDYRNLDFLTKELLLLLNASELAKLQEKSTSANFGQLSKIYDDTAFIQAELHTLEAVFIGLPLFILTIAILFQIMRKKERYFYET